MVDTTLDNNRHRFNEWAQTYEHSFMQWLIFNRVHQAVLKHLPAGFTPTHLLDIGCGTGRLLRLIHSKWPAAMLVGIDPSDGMVAI
jgi:trans-aconitate methyltransferase